MFNKMNKLTTILALLLFSVTAIAQGVQVSTQQEFEQLQNDVNSLAQAQQITNGNLLALSTRLDSLITALRDTTTPPPPSGKWQVIVVKNADQLRAAINNPVDSLHIKLMGGIFDFRPYEALQISKTVWLDGSEGAQASYLFGAQLILREGAKNSRLEHLNIYVGDGAPDKQISERDAFKNKANNVTVVNCTFGFAVDELVQNLGADVTFYRCLYQYALASPLHDKGEHQKGLLLLHYEGNQGTNTLINQCAFLANLDRNPQFNPGTAGALANTYIYQCKFGVGFSTNRGIDKPPLLASAQNIVIEKCWKTWFRPVYFNKNFAGAAKIYAKDWLANGEFYENPWTSGGWLRKIYGQYEAVEPPMPLPKLIPLDQVKAHVLAVAGARRDKTDSLTQAAINAAINGTEIPTLSTAKGHWPKPIEL